MASGSKEIEKRLWSELEEAEGARPLRIDRTGRHTRLYYEHRGVERFYLIPSTAYDGSKKYRAKLIGDLRRQMRGQGVQERQRLQPTT